MSKLKTIVTMALASVALGSCAECDKKSAECAEQDKSSVVIENILTRRSIRDYKDEPVAREDMARILECGIYAPSAMNKQLWAVRVVDSREFIDGVTAVALEQNPAIGEQPGFRNIFRNAPTVAFIAIPEESYSGEFDSGLLSQNMMLAAWSMGIGSCCLGSVVPVMTSPAAKPYLEQLNLPEGYKLMVGIAFGYPAQEPPTAPERDTSKAYYVE